MRKEVNKNRRIELRDDDFSRRIGEVPASLVKWGYVVIATVVLLLLLALCLVTYPYSHGESLLRHFLLL